VWFLRIMHVKINLLHYIRDVRPGKGEILEGTDETLKLSGIFD
jgi:hypothetical protein